MNTKPLFRVNTMLMGHIVTADVLKVVNSDRPGDYSFHCRFVCHTETGKVRICLDIGQNWYADSTTLFVAQPCNIKRAAELLRKPVPEFIVTDDDVAKIKLAIF